jgi:hypothetical protein
LQRSLSVRRILLIRWLARWLIGWRLRRDSYISRKQQGKNAYRNVSKPHRVILSTVISVLDFLKAEAYSSRPAVSNANRRRFAEPAFLQSSARLNALAVHVKY